MSLPSDKIGRLTELLQARLVHLNLTTKDQTVTGIHHTHSDPNPIRPSSCPLSCPLTTTTTTTSTAFSPSLIASSDEGVPTIPSASVPWPRKLKTTTINQNQSVEPSENLSSHPSSSVNLVPAVEGRDGTDKLSSLTSTHNCKKMALESAVFWVSTCY
ncbi:hypothetical protein MJO28_012915 [Puccinia striiformis f. sp. tritici]|uniref:Uncharacterized protein n=1 Tax=Puccinia striiformis f. sp. tritici TaxID=168172 RepID=A0ACC0DY29_9BASI|nr:hypothetical protein MJO28_012915 [Puccinia striiformis f. sp. tritici]